VATRMNLNTWLSFLLSNPAILVPVVTSVLSFGFKWLSNHSSGGAKMASAVSVDVPLFVEGALECLGKKQKLPE